MPHQGTVDTNGTDNRDRRSESQKTQTKQTTHQDIANADRVSYKKRRQSKLLTKAQQIDADGTNNRDKRNKSQKTQIKQIIHQDTTDADGANKAPDNAEKHKQQTQTEQATKDVNGIDDLLRHSRHKQSRQQMQIEQTTEDADKQTTHQDIVNVDKANHGRHKRANNLLRHSKCKQSKSQKKQISKQLTKVQQT